MKLSAAYNTMNEFERQCYDWGWQDSQERIIKLLWEKGEIITNKFLEHNGLIGEPIAFLVSLIEAKEKIMSTQKIEPYTIELTDPEQIKMWEENAEAIRKIHETIDQHLKVIKGEQK